MAKTNFSKVELSLEEGMRKMAVSKLCDLADIASDSTDSSSKREKRLNKKQLTAINKITWGLKRLEKKEPKIYVILNISKDDLQKKLANAKELTDTEWKALYSYLHEIQSLVKKLLPEETNEKIIEEQQLANKKKRININDQWIAL